MTKILNLRLARKQRARADRRAEGDAKAARFGEAGHLRDARHAETERATARLEAHRQDGSAPRDD